MRYKTIPAVLFIKNREKLLGILEENSMAVLHSNDQMVRCGDQYFPFRQSSDFFYLSGIEQEMSILLLCPDHPDKKKSVMLFIRKPNPAMETWEGKKLSRAQASKISGIQSVYWLDNFETISRELILQRKNIYTRSEEHIKFRTDYPSRDERFQFKLKQEYPSHEFKRLTPLMKKLRLKKEPEELEMISEAIRITASGFSRVASMLKAGIREYEIEAELTHEFIRKGASGNAYPPIIASGGNACILHYIQNDQVCLDGQLLLMDFGAEYGNYSADCSRTIPVNGKFTGRQKEVYEATLRIFHYARSLMKPGASIEELHKKVCIKSQEEHIGLGLYSKGDVEKQKKDDPMFMQYYMHGTSHFMGLDVHDVGDKSQVLEPGMVLTCEPGIYIPGEKMGVRLEDDILITPEGNVDLMKDIPIELTDIESLLNS